MKVFLLKDDEWQEYSKELLDKDQAYKFVAWVAKRVVLVAPAEIDGREFYHKNVVEHAIGKGVINEESGKPDAYGAIRVIFRKEDVDNRICFWTSQSYGTTPEDLRPQIREVLGLEDVIYKD